MTETDTDALMEILPGLLAPLLMGGSVAEPARARRAAEQAIAQYQVGYRSGTRGELVTIGQIVAFALTAIDNLRLSMPDTVSMTTKLKLRGNASALNRASLHAVEALDKARAAADSAWAENADPDPVETPAMEPVAPPDPATLPDATVANPTPPPREVRIRQHWATAMTTVADELRTRTPHVPPVQRRSDQLWVKVLAKVAGELRHPDRPSSPPHLSKADLFRTTIMAGNSTFPAHLTPETPSSRVGG